MEAFEGKTVPELADKYAKIMEEYRGVEKEVGTPEAFKWKSNTWDKLTFDAVEDYLTSNSIEPKDDDEVEVAFEEHKKVFHGIVIPAHGCPAHGIGSTGAGSSRVHSAALL